MLDRLYENIGAKIKNWAKWIFIAEAIGAIITGLALLFSDEELILGFLVMILGPIVAWVGSWILYAFGELVEDVHAIRNRGIPTTANKSNSPTNTQTSAQFTDVLRNAANKQKETVKRCPYCGDIVKLGRCEMCGQEVK
jgi:predicted RNA-binding Zn-ribbon protein involved in translation (DUF1610 family)